MTQMLYRVLPKFNFHQFNRMAVGTTSASQPPQASTAPAAQDAAKDEFDIVKTYRSLLASDPEMTMPVAAIESLIELLRAKPSSTAMETVEIVRDEKQKLLDAFPNPLPIRAGADLFEQFLLRSLRGPSADEGPGHRLSFDETRAHLLQNSNLFAQRAREAREAIASHGAKYILDGRTILVSGGSRVVTSILLRAASDPGRHFNVIYVDDESPRTEKSIAALRAAGLDVETIDPRKVAVVLSQCWNLNLVLTGAEVVCTDGSVISRMGTSQLAFLCKHMPGASRRFFVAAETHKIVRVPATFTPIVNRVGIRQKDMSKWNNIGKPTAEGDFDPEDEVDHTERELVDGIITENGVKEVSQIWEYVADYI